MATWHPIMNIREGPVGTWSLIGPLDEPYATISCVLQGVNQRPRVLIGRSPSGELVLPLKRRGLANSDIWTADGHVLI